MRAKDLIDGAFERCGEGFGDGCVHEDTLCGHAHLAAVLEGAPRAPVRRFLQIGVLQDDGGRFAAEFHEDGFEVSACCGGDEGSYRRATCVVYFLDGRVGDDGVGDFGRVLRAVEEDIEGSGGQTGFLEDGSDEPEAARGDFRPFEHAGVARREGVAARAEPEDVGGVPGGDAEDDAVGFFEDQCRFVLLAADGDVAGGGDDAAGDVAEHLNGGGHVEAGRVALDGARFDFHVLGRFGGAAGEDVAGLEEDVAAVGGFGLGPCWVGGLGCFDGADGIVAGGGGAVPDELVGDGGDDGEGGGGGVFGAGDVEGDHVIEGVVGDVSSVAVGAVGMA